MAYVGNSPAEIYSSVQKQTITGDGTVGPYTLDYPAATNDVSVFVNNVRQEPTVAYTVSGTSMTMTGAVASTDDFYVVFSGLTQGTITPPDGSVTSAKLDTNIAISGTLTTSGTLDVNSTLDVSSSNFKMTDLTSNAFYRTGTFTPEFSSLSATDPTAGILTGTYGFQIGEYTRIGDLVRVDILVKCPSTISYTNGGAASQAMTIVGLPFRIKNTTNYYPAGSFGFYNGWAWAAGYTPAVYGVYNTKRVNVVYVTANNTSNIFTNNALLANAQIGISFTYQTDEA